MVILSDTTNKNPKPKVTRAEGLSTFSPIIALCNHHPYTSCNHKNTNREEEPKEPLSIVTEIAAI